MLWKHTIDDKVQVLPHSDFKVYVVFLENMNKQVTFMAFYKKLNVAFMYEISPSDVACTLYILPILQTNITLCV